MVVMAKRVASILREKHESLVQTSNRPSRFDSSESFEKAGSSTVDGCVLHSHVSLNLLFTNRGSRCGYARPVPQTYFGNRCGVGSHLLKYCVSLSRLAQSGMEPGIDDTIIPMFCIQTLLPNVSTQR